MSTELATTAPGVDPRVLESVLITGNIDQLNVQQRLEYLNAVCKSVGLNPLTRPFDYLRLNGKTVLYAKRDATDQLRAIHNVSVKLTDKQRIGDVFSVSAQATMPSGRTDESTGAVPMEGLKGDALANALMKAETKAKRRVTLSICGLGILDESEIETTDAKPVRESAPQNTTTHVATEAVRSNSGHSGETASRQGPERREIPPASTHGSEPIPPALQAIFSVMGSSKKNILAEFSNMRKSLVEVAGDTGTDTYCRIIDQHAFDPTNVQSVGKARECMADLYKELHKLIAPDAAFEATDDDLPTELGGTYQGGPNPAEKRREMALVGNE